MTHKIKSVDIAIVVTLLLLLARLITWVVDLLLKSIRPKRVRRPSGGENA